MKSSPRARSSTARSELDRLTGDLLAGQKVFLISPRRYGKSSLVTQALRGRGEAGALTVDVTVSSYSSYVAFLEGYARALLSVEPPSTAHAPGCATCSAACGPRCGVEPGSARRRGGSSRVSFPCRADDKDVSRLAQEVFALPGKIAAARKRKLAIALDEFQAIGSFNGGSVEHALRAAVQHQREVGYVFSGSEPALMERMLGRSRPFYKAGPVMRLQKIPADRFAEFLEARFKASGVKPVAGLGAAIVELAGNLPYDVQRLAHEMWDDVRAAGRKTADVEDLHETLKRLLGEHETLFESVWQRLTLAQRATLRAAVLAGRARAAVGRRAGPLPPERRVDRAGRPSRRSCAKTSSPARARATWSSIRCCVSGSRGEPIDAARDAACRACSTRIGLGSAGPARLGMYDWANSAYPDDDHRGGLSRSTSNASPPTGSTDGGPCAASPGRPPSPS